MNTIKRTTFRKRIFGGAVVIGLACASSAHACDTPGFLAQLAAPVIGCGAAQAGDRINAQGHYVEAGVAAGANAIFPGAGPIVAGGFALQQSGALSAFNPPGSVPMPPPGFGGVPMPVGNFCATGAGVFPLFRPGPVGAGCGGPFGPGQIVP